MSIKLPLVVILSCSLFAVISLWAATAKLPWSFRTTIVAVFLGCLLLIPAYEPILFFLVQCLVVVFGVQLTTARKGGLHRLFGDVQFSLRSLLISTVLVAAILAVMAHVPPHEPVVWGNLLSASMASGLVTLLATEVVFAQGRRRISMLAAVILTPLIAGPAAFTDGMLSGYGFARGPGPISARWLWVLYSMLLLLTTWLMLWRQSYGTKNRVRLDGNRTRQTVSRAALAVVTILVVLPCAYVYLWLIVFYVSPGRPPNTIGSPNGYDDLVQAASLYVPQNAVETLSESTSDAEIERSLLANKAALTMLRRGLQLPCEQHVEFKRHLQIDRVRLTRMINLAKLMNAQAELAVRRRRIADASLIYADIIRFGQCLEHGGLLIDSSLSNIVQAVGQDGLSKLRHQLSRKERRRLVDELSDLDRRREPWKSLYQRDQYLSVVNIGWLGRLYRMLEGEALFLRGLLNKRLRVVATTRLLVVEFAIMGYMEDNGVLPTSLEALELDDSVLIDPFSPNQARLQYRRSNQEFSLYSVGPDGDDDGGIRDPTNPTAHGDYFLQD